MNQVKEFKAGKVATGITLDQQAINTIPSRALPVFIYTTLFNS